MENPTQTAPYGTWESPITAELLSENNITLNEVEVDTVSGAIYLVEGRPSENGRCCIVEYSNSTGVDILPAQYNVRSRVHEYGGAACTIGPGGRLVFTDWNTNGIFSLSAGHIRVILEGSAEIFFADFDVHPSRPECILAVQEDHRSTTIQNRIVTINGSTGNVSYAVQGADFYAHPRFNHDGTRICWTQWDHPDMPWTGSKLYVDDWVEGQLLRGNFVAGKSAVESICQPRWSGDGTLYFVSDRTGFWQIYHYVDEKTRRSSRTELISLKAFEDADFAGPENILGNCTYVLLNENELVAVYTKNATNGVLVIDVAKQTCIEVPLGLVDIQRNALRRVSDTSFVVIGASQGAPSTAYLVDVGRPSQNRVVKASSSLSHIPQPMFSLAEPISFPRCYGKDQGGLSYAIFNPPRNPAYSPMADSRPPLIVSLHGGPTSHVSPALLLLTQYWTSRGYAYAHVNYSGSTGYGRAYRDTLNGVWGMLDASDAASCVQYLADSSQIDASRVGIIGASAGGYGVLQALSLHPKMWAGGVSLYGIGDLKALAGMMHKFEKFYIQQLLFGVGYQKSVKEQENIYRDRSPCYHADHIAAPVMFMQGTEDKVVPLCQAQDMARVMKSCEGTDVKLLVFEGEGHGFRQKANLRRALEEEEAWWRRTLVRT